MRKREHACIYVTLDSFAATMLLFCEKPFKSFSQSAKKSSSSTFLLLLSSCSCVSKNSWKQAFEEKKKRKQNGMVKMEY